MRKFRCWAVIVILVYPWLLGWFIYFHNWLVDRDLGSDMLFSLALFAAFAILAPCAPWIEMLSDTGLIFRNPFVTMPTGTGFIVIFVSYALLIWLVTTIIIYWRER